MKLSTHSYLLLQLRMSGDVPSLPCISAWCAYGQLYHFNVGSLNCLKIACVLYTSSHLLCVLTKSSIAFICCTLHSISFVQNTVFIVCASIAMNGDFLQRKDADLVSGLRECGDVLWSEWYLIFQTDIMPYKYL